jgi:hypothetical protein
LNRVLLLQANRNITKEDARKYEGIVLLKRKSDNKNAKNFG